MLQHGINEEERNPVEQKSEKMIKIVKWKKVKTVISYQMILVTVANVVDERSHHEQYDKIESQGLFSRSYQLIVQNPSVVLHCLK